jgi:hypothetical protein
MPRFDLAEKIEATILRQVPEVADQVCNGMLVTGAAMPLKNVDGLGGPRDVVGFIGHASIGSVRAKSRRRSFSVRRHRSEIMLGVLVVILRPDYIAGLSLSFG